MKLPVYELTISEDLQDDAEVNFVALVDKPAIQKNWYAFNKSQNFKIVSEDKRIISGALMLADTPIFRSDSQHGDYYVTFGKQTIFKIVQKFFKKGYQANVNIMHDPNQKVKGVTLFESFISDKDRGILPMEGFEDAPDGSWFGSMFVEDDKTWEDVKSNKYSGFSVEGIFEYSIKDNKGSESMFMDIGNIFGGPGSGRKKGSGNGDSSSSSNVSSKSLDSVISSKGYSPLKKKEMIKDAESAVRLTRIGRESGNPQLSMSNLITEYSTMHGLSRNEAINILADVELDMINKKGFNENDIMFSIMSILQQVK